MANCKIKVKLVGEYKTGFYDDCSNCGPGFFKRIRKKKERTTKKMMNFIEANLEAKGYQPLNSYSEADHTLDVHFSHDSYSIEGHHFVDMRFTDKRYGSKDLYQGSKSYYSIHSTYNGFIKAVKNTFKINDINSCH